MKNKAIKIAVVADINPHRAVGGLDVFINQITRRLHDKYACYHVLRPYEYNNKAKEGTLDYDIVHAIDRHAFKAIIANDKPENLLITFQLSFNLLYGDTHKKVGDEFRKVERKAMDMADYIHHVSEGYAKRFGGTYANKSYVIHNGVDVKSFEQAGETMLPGENDRKILFISRISPQKNIHNIIKCRIPDNCDLVFAGRKSSGTLGHRLNTFVRNNDNAYHIGPQWGDAKHRVFNAADAVLFPSIHEPFGIVGLEAMASESVLLTSGVDGIDDYLRTDMNYDIHIDTGTSSTSIQEALNRFSELSSSKMHNMVTKSKCQAALFSWDRTAERLQLLYNQLVGNQPNLPETL